MSRASIALYAMYVIGKVESNHRWTAVNYNDPITIGMLQWYGTRAAHLLGHVKDMVVPNLLLNGGFETDTNGDGLSDSWAVSASLATFTASRPAGEVGYGQKVRITRNAVGGSTYPTFTQSISGRTAGEVVTGTIRYRNLTYVGFAPSLRVKAYNAAWGIITQPSAVLVANDSAWRTASITLTIPAGTQNVGVVIQQTQANVGDYFEIEMDAAGFTLQSDWAYLAQYAPDLVADVNAKAATDDWWNDRDLTRDEGNALIHIMKGDANHAIQQAQWSDDANYYIDGPLAKAGLTESRPRELIFAMCVYHRRPRSCANILASAGGSATLDRLYSVTLNHAVESGYKPRYKAAYDMLKAWDGVSAAPDFGQVDDENLEDGGDSPQDEPQLSELGYIMQQGDNLMLYGGNLYKNGVTFAAAGGGSRWLCSMKPDQTPVVDGDTDTGTSVDGAAVVAKMESYLGDLRYSQGAGRMSPDTSGYSDCSALIWYCYKKITGKQVGTWTGQQATKGTNIYSGLYSGLNLASLHVGDVIVWNKHSTGVPGLNEGHAALWYGGGNIIDHGGGMGPKIRPIPTGYTWVTIRRHV